MAYKLVKGQFELYYKGARHVGSRPDGDSVWFRPGSSAQMSDIDPDRDVEFNGGGLVQLRFEGIDALELHYKGPNHQLEEPTVAARDYLLEKMGFTEVEYAPSDDIDTYVRSSEPALETGYILTKNVDPFGRPVAFVFTGSTQEQDGKQVWLEPARMRDSLNAKLMSAGHVYPGYYNSLPWDLRDELTRLADNAWSYDMGVWDEDRSLSGFVAQTDEALEKLAIWPKLYRRLFAYFADGNTGLKKFESWLQSDDRDDELWIMSRGQSGFLHEVIEIRGNRVRLLFWPEDLILTPR